MEHNLTNENLFKVCRTCLVQTEDMKDIFTSSLDKLLKECTSLEVNSNDGLPTLICETCISRVNDAYSFKILCENSSQRLKEFVATSTVKEESTEVIDILVECYEYNSDQASPVDNVEDEENSEDTKLDITETSTEELRESAEKVPLNLLPEKSKLRYEKTYESFRDWCSKQGVENFTSESVILAYFGDVAKTKKPSTMWALYSMLRSTVNFKHNVDISKYSKLIAYLKKQNLGYQPTKSSTFTKDNVENFLKNAPFHFLPLKAALVIGISGACRSDELFKMKTADIDLEEHRAVIVIPSTQSYQPRSFLITNIAWLEILKSYVNLRKNVEGDRFFLQLRHGKLTKQPYGHNSISQFPKKIATYLQLSNANTYTGYCFRRTAARLRANDSGGTRHFKKVGRWNATTVAEARVGTSLDGQVEDPVNVPNVTVPDPSSSSPQSHVSKEQWHEEVDLKMEDHDNDTFNVDGFLYPEDLG